MPRRWLRVSVRRLKTSLRLLACPLVRGPAPPEATGGRGAVAVATEAMEGFAEALGDGSQNETVSVLRHNSIALTVTSPP